MSVHCHTCDGKFLEELCADLDRMCGCGIAACSHECLQKHAKENHLGTDGKINWPHGTMCGACWIDNPTNIVTQPRTLVSLCSSVIVHTDAAKQEEKVPSDDEEGLYD